MLSAYRVTITSNPLTRNGTRQPPIQEHRALLPDRHIGDQEPGLLVANPAPAPSWVNMPYLPR